MVASRDEKKPPNKLVVYPLTVPSGRGVQLSPVSTKLSPTRTPLSPFWGDGFLSSCRIGEYRSRRVGKSRCTYRSATPGTLSRINCIATVRSPLSSVTMVAKGVPQVVTGEAA